MRQLKVKEHLSEKEIELKIKTEKNKEQLKRWQCISLVQKLKKIKAETIAKIIGSSVHLVYYIIESYNNAGESGIKIQGRGGRRTSYLSIAEEKNLMLSLEENAKKGLILTKEDIRGVVEKKIGKKVSDDYLIDLFHRNEWSKKEPRPEHPEKNIEEQEEFKKKSLKKKWHPPSNHSALSKKIKK